MSKAALYDAFIAGWTSYKQGAGWDGLDEAFEKWWTQAVDTADRAPPAPVCPDNYHDYRVDDSDGLLKCITCKKVLF